MGNQRYSEIWAGVLTWVWEGTKPGQAVPDFKRDLRAKWASPESAVHRLVGGRCAEVPNYFVPTSSGVNYERLAESPSLNLAKAALSCLYPEPESWSNDGNIYIPDGSKF
jgi:hypothetical protein